MWSRMNSKEAYWKISILAGLFFLFATDSYFRLTLPVEYAQIQKMENVYPATLIIVVGFLSPIGEELLFRGLGYRAIRFLLTKENQHLSQNRLFVSMFLSAVLFGLAHGHPIQQAYATIAGFCLAWWYERTGNLKYPILAHMTVNVTSIFFSYLFPSYLNFVNFS